MSMEAALRARLKAAAPVATRARSIDWVQRRQRADGLPDLPAIVLTLISSRRDATMNGEHGLRRARVQIDVLANDQVDKIALREAVIDAITPRTTTGGVRFERAFIDDIRDLSAEAGGRFIHRDSLDVRLWHALED